MLTASDLAAIRDLIRSEVQALLSPAAARDADERAFVAVLAACLPPGIEFTANRLADTAVREIHEGRERYRLRTPAQLGRVLRNCHGLRVGDVRLVRGPRGSYGRRWVFEPVTE